MAGPITWRNIQTGAGGGAGQLLAAGQAQVQQGFNVLQDLFKGNAAEDRQNREAIKNYNTQQYLDQVAATDLATLATPEGQAALAQQRQGFGTAIDQAGTRNAIEQRLAAGQKAAVQQGQFDDFNLERDQRALVDNIRGLQAQGKVAEVNQILDENQFLNEGELRKELAGVQDNLRQRELRETAEGRAVRGEQRSAASHALSMEAGRENLSYSKLMHVESIRKINEDRAADQIAFREFDASKQDNEMQKTLISEIAAANDLEVKADGTIDLEGTSDEQKNTIAKQLEDSGAGGQSVTAQRQRIVEEARAAGMGAAATQAALARFDTVRTFDALAPEDQAKLQNEVSTATRELRDTETRLTETFNRKSKDNPYLAPSNDTVGDANKLVAAMSKKFDGEWFTTDIARDNVAASATDLLQNGISFKLDGKDFTGVVTPSLIERAMDDVGANKIQKEGGDLQAAVETFIKNNPGIQKQMRDSVELTKQYQQDMAKIGSEKIKIENALTKARKKEKGVTVSNNDWVDTLIDRRNRSGN